MILKMNMPQGAKKIIDTLMEHGYEAYIVGGCVRDALLGKEPADWDITTSAKPEDVKKLFKRTIDTGIAHGTVTVMDGKDGYEVTTYRIDGKYSDHRRPEQVTFTASLLEDLKRRDFTINAMAYNDKEGLIDLFGGRKDLADGIIRCVGEASKRFDEDALRILRAVRFSAQLGFEIEDKTQDAIKKQAIFLKDISAERIQVELTKLLMSDHPEKMRDAYTLGITKIVMPEFDVMMECEQDNPHHKYTVGEHSIVVMQNVKKEKALRFAALLHDVGKPSVKTKGKNGIDHFYNHAAVGAEMARKILRRLKFDNATIDRVCRLVLWHDYGIGDFDVNEKNMRYMLHKIGPDLIEELIEIKYADIYGQSAYQMDEKLDKVRQMEQTSQLILSRGDCISLKQLALTGSDLIALGEQPGKEIGVVLNAMLMYCLEDPTRNDKECLVEYYKTLGKKK